MGILNLVMQRAAFVVLVAFIAVAATSGEAEVDALEAQATADKWAYVPDTKSVAKQQKKAVKMLAKGTKGKWVPVTPGKTASQVLSKQKLLKSRLAKGAELARKASRKKRAAK